VFEAVAFTVRGETGTWLAINDRRDDFPAKSDLIIYLAAYSVSRTSLLTIAGSKECGKRPEMPMGQSLGGERARA
jgi:hypothetical protein